MFSLCAGCVTCGCSTRTPPGGVGKGGSCPRGEGGISGGGGEVLDGPVDAVGSGTPRGDSDSSGGGGVYTANVLMGVRQARATGGRKARRAGGDRRARRAKRVGASMMSGRCENVRLAVGGAGYLRRRGHVMWRYSVMRLYRHHPLPT